MNDISSDSISDSASNSTGFKAYKVFNPDWTCKDFQYEVGKEYWLPEGEKPILCERGFHACRKAQDCFSYYSFDPSNKVAEVILLGEIVGVEDDKQCSQGIRIEKEISWTSLLDLINIGKGNSGLGNSGDRNSGDRNSGDRNSGDRNSGDWNSGARSSGDWNSGDWNSGDWNSGDWNSGARNSGARNSGDRNSGDRNSGDGNSGNRNSGNWNSCSYSSGFFCSQEPPLYLFNQPAPGHRREDLDFPSFLYFDLTEWVNASQATEEEKEKYSRSIETSGGLLRTYEYKEAFQRAYAKASTEDKQKLKKLPNFDPDVFFEISGIRVE